MYDCHATRQSSAKVHVERLLTALERMGGEKDRQLGLEASCDDELH